MGPMSTTSRQNGSMSGYAEGFREYEQGHSSLSYSELQLARIPINRVIGSNTATNNADGPTCSHLSSAFSRSYEQDATTSSSTTSSERTHSTSDSSCPYLTHGESLTTMGTTTTTVTTDAATNTAAATVAEDA